MVEKAKEKHQHEGKILFCRIKICFRGDERRAVGEIVSSLIRKMSFRLKDFVLYTVVSLLLDRVKVEFVDVRLG